jgi:peptide/nickel transport system substrate-binding protein
MGDLRLTRRTALAGTAASGLAACLPAPPRPLRQLVVSVSSDITTLDPATTFLPANLIAPHVCYERLLRLTHDDGVTTGVEGDLAEHWEVAPDKSAMTFHLREGARYDDGSDVVASDFIFSIERILKRKFPAAQALFWYGGAEAPDQRTLRIKLTAFAPFIPYLLTSPGLGFVNPAVARFAKGGDLGSAWLRENSAGSGPFRVSAFAHREEVRLIPNPHARRAPAYFTDVRLRASKDPTIRLIELEKGDVDLVEAVGPFQQDWLNRQSGLVVASGPAPIVLFLQLNTEREIFRDVRVRESISLAIDREAIARSVFRGQARLIPGVLPPGVPGHDPSLPLPRHDIGRAQALMREAGIAPGRRIDLTVVGDGGGPSATQLTLRESLQALGFDVNIKQIAASARSQIFKGEFDITTQSISIDFPDPWIVFTFVYSSQMIGAGNMSRYANPKLDALLARADKIDGAARIALYQEAQRIVMTDLPAIPLLQTSWGFAHRRAIAPIDYNFSTPMMLPLADLRRTSP